VDGLWIFYLFLAAFPGMIAYAAIYKYLQVRRARLWPSVKGRVVASTSTRRNVKGAGADSTDTEVRNFANVVYEYKIAATTYRGDRVSVAEDTGNLEVAETLAKYPVGQEVTVYYNPNNRAEALLERDVPSFLWKGAAGIVLGLCAIIVGSIYGFKWLAVLVAATIPNTEKAPFVTACIGFAMLWGLVLVGMQRAASKTQRWPTAPGRVETSDVQSRQVRSRSTNQRSASWKTRYRPKVVYGYDVAGVHYRGDKISYSGAAGSSDALAQKIVERYPVGTPLTVHYNPDSPGESAIDPRVPPGLYVFYLVPVIVLAIGYLAAR